MRARDGLTWAHAQGKGLKVWTQALRSRDAERRCTQSGVRWGACERMQTHACKCMQTTMQAHANHADDAGACPRGRSMHAHTGMHAAHTRGRMHVFNAKTLDMSAVRAVRGCRTPHAPSTWARLRPAGFSVAICPVLAFDTDLCGRKIRFCMNI
eukprot:360995-Chlamydomonas_euryale.AAC.2